MAAGHSTWWVSLLIFIPYAVVLYFAHESYQRHVFHHTLLIIILFCIITPFYFYPVGVTETYIILKYFVITIFLLLISFVRIRHYKQVQLSTNFQRMMFKWASTQCCYSERTMFVIFYILSILNLFDSILIEYLSGWFLNSLCGILLCCTIPIPQKLAYPIHEWSIESASTLHTLSVHFRGGWILLYSSWNLCFIYTVFPAHLIKHGFIVFIPLIKALLSEHRFSEWLSARIYTQSLFYFGYLVICVYRFTSSYIMDSEIDRIIERSVLQQIDTKVDNRTFINLWAAANCVASAAYSVWWFRWICKQNAKKYRVLQTEDDMDAEFGEFDIAKYEEEEDDLETELTNVGPVGDQKNADYAPVNPSYDAVKV